MKNLLVQTKFNWSCAGWPVLIVRTVRIYKWQKKMTWNKFIFRKTDTAYLCSLMLYIQSNLYTTITVGTRHSTAAGYQANCPSNCSFPWLLCFQKWKCQSENKIWLCLAYWFCRILLLLLDYHLYLKMSGMPCGTNGKWLHKNSDCLFKIGRSIPGS